MIIYKKKGSTLETTIPSEIGLQLYKHFTKEVEYWKPEDMLDIIKKSVFAESSKNQQLVGLAKQILDYRNWIAHGKNPDNKQSVVNIIPSTVYNTLNEIITLVYATEVSI